MDLLFPNDQIWMIVVGFIIAFILAFGIGANDVANTFGSSVGSGVLTLKQACILATICEFSGSLLLGSKVSSTVRKGIVKTELFGNGTTELMAGQVSALGGSCVWMLMATFLKLPVSGTHSIVGATMGFSLVLFGHRAINWIGVAKIVASWFISPLISGAVSVSIFVLIHYLVLIKDEPLEPALRLLPGFYGTMVAVNTVSILLGGSEALKFNRIPIYGTFILGCGGGTITVILIKLFLLPHLRKRILAGESMTPKCLTKLENACQCLAITRCCQRCKRKKRARLLLKEQSNNASVDQPIPQVLVRESGNKVTVDLQMHDRAIADTANGFGANRAISGNGESDEPQAVVRGKSSHRAFEVRPVDLNSPDQSTRPPLGFNQLSAHDNVEHGVSMTKRAVLAQPSLPAIGEEDTEVREVVKDRPIEAKVFWLLQVMTSVLGSFAHGGNDVSNAIGPLMGLWIVGITQNVNSKMANPYWILAYGGVGISVGLWVWGRRVIRTLGKDLTTITPSSGVSIELGSALTVLLASKLGLPVSTTHCQVGSVIFVGRFRSRDNVDWSLFRNIIIAWVVTVPVTCGLSAFLMYLCTFTF